MQLREPFLANRPIGRSVIRAFCLYELLALSSERVPTLSNLTHRYRSTWPGRAVILFIVSWLAHHLFIERAAILAPILNPPLEA